MNRDFHKIGKATFDIEFDSEDLAFSEQSSLETFTGKRLVPLVDEVLTMNTIYGNVITFDTLEIDLGNISFENYQDEIITRLRDRLDSLIKEKINLINHGVSKEDGIVADRKSDFSKVEYFLLNGVMPWSATLKDNLDINLAMVDRLDTDSRAFVDFLRKTPHKEIVLNRILRQFAPEVVQKIVGLFSGESPGVLDQHIRSILKTGLKADETNKPEGPGPADSYALEGPSDFKYFEKILINALEHGSERDFIMCCADLFKGYPVETRTAILKYAENSEGRDKILARLFGNIGRVAQYIRSILNADEINAPGEPAPPDSNAVRSTADFLYLEKALINALEHGTEKDFIVCCVDLFKGYPVETRATILQYARNSDGRERILARLSGNTGGVAQYIRSILKGEEINTPGEPDPLDSSAIRSASDFQYLEKVLIDALEHGTEKDFIMCCADLYKGYPVETRTAILQYAQNSDGRERILARFSGNTGSVAQDIRSILHAEEINAPGESDSPDSYTPENTSDFLYLEKILIHTLEHGTENDFFMCCENLSKRYPFETGNAILKYAKKSDGRKRIFTRLSGKRLYDLICLFAKNNNEFIYALINIVDERLSSVIKANRKVNILFAVFNSLFVHEVDKSGKKPFTRAIIIELSLRYRKSYDELILSLQDSCSMVKNGNIHEKQVIALVEELATDLNREKTVRVGPDINSEKMVRAYGLADRLRVLIFKRELPCVGDGIDLPVDKVALELQRVYPALLPTILNELRAQPSLSDEISRNLSTKELKVFVIVLITASSQVNDEKITLLIDRLEELSLDKEYAHEYFTEALSQIVHGSAIDIDEILKQKIEQKGPEKSLSKYNRVSKLKIIPEDARIKRLIPDLESIMSKEPDQLYHLLTKHLRDKRVITELISFYPEMILTRILFILVPLDYCNIQKYADVIVNAYVSSDTGIRRGNIVKVKWKYILTYLRSKRFRLDNDVDFIKGFIQFLGQGETCGEVEFCTGLSSLLISRMHSFARKEYTVVLKVISEIVSDLKVQNTAPQSLQKPYGRVKEETPSNYLASNVESQEIDSDKVMNNMPETITHDAQADIEREQQQLSHQKEEIAGDIYILNAGLVIGAPYFPRLFSAMGFDEKLRDNDFETAERCSHLLQYMVNRSVETPEYELALNKILCGISPGLPIIKGIKITQSEEEFIEGLIKGMIQNWPIIGNTSVEGFRQSFLLREGRLRFTENEWVLKVAPKPYDMLLDNVPWSFSMIKHSWMQNIVSVDWR
ncbi:MAG: hypothetical protein GY941_08330 [Planctomycetes bacterium]|nr:hypothetical protein [Planctomycetota bacterium]